MGIYNTNSYNPLGSIQAALNNVNEKNRIKNEYWKNKGQIWSNFAQNIGNIGNRMLDGIVAYSEGYDANDPEARLAALEKELKDAEEAEMEEEAKNAEIERLNYINKQADNMSGYKPKESAIASNLMEGYIPAEANPYTRGSLIYEPNYEDVAQQNSVPLGYRPTYGIMKDYIPNEVNSYRHPYEEREYNPYDVYGMMQDFYRRGI